MHTITRTNGFMGGLVLPPLKSFGRLVCLALVLCSPAALAQDRWTIFNNANQTMTPDEFSVTASFTSGGPWTGFSGPAIPPGTSGVWTSGGTFCGRPNSPTAGIYTVISSFINGGLQWQTPGGPAETFNSTATPISDPCDGVTVYLFGGIFGGGGPNSINVNSLVNLSGCLTISNTSDQTIYGFPQEQMIDSGGVHNTPIGPCGNGQYMEIPPGQSLKLCDSGLSTTYGNIQNGATASLQFVQVNMSGGAVPCGPQGPVVLAGNCVSLCTADGLPFNPGPLNSGNVIGSAPENPVSTNGVSGSGVAGSGSSTIPDTGSGVLYPSNIAPSIQFPSTNSASIAQTGFDALYDVENKQLIELQHMDNNQLAEAMAVESNATGNANAVTAGVTNAIGGLRSTMAGLSNVIAQWGSGSASGSNGPIIWTEPASMSNQLGAIQSSTALLVTNIGQLISNNLANGGYLADFSNGFNQLNADLSTNAQEADSNTAYLAAISNNTAQPNRYTNINFGSAFPTNAADIGNLGSNQVGDVAASIQSLGDTLKAQADSINGNGPGGDGSIFTVHAQAPSPSGGTVTYTFDMNPMDYPAVVDLAAFTRKLMTWMVGIGVLLKMIGDVSAAVGQMMSTAQGQVPRVTVLGNTVGWAVAAIYLVGIVAVLVGVPLFIATYLTSNGFGPTLWSQIQTNPFSSSGYGASMVGALWLADKFVPLYFVVATALYYAAFRFSLVRIIAIVAAVVRAFMA